jgi:hypothetical protein
MAVSPRTNLHGVVQQELLARLAVALAVGFGRMAVSEKRGTDSLSEYGIGWMSLLSNVTVDARQCRPTVWQSGSAEWQRQCSTAVWPSPTLRSAIAARASGCGLPPPGW